MTEVATNNDDELSQIREAVRALCAEFPGEYWRELDRERAYPTEFVAGADRGRLPRRADPGGVRRLGPRRCRRRRRSWRRSTRSGGNGARLPRPDVHHGHAAAARQRRAEGSATCRRSPSGELRLQAFGVTEPTSGTDTTAHHDRARREGDSYVVNGQKIWTSRAEHSDLMLLLARTTPREQVDEAHRRAVGVPGRHARGAQGTGLTIRPIRTMMNHATTEVFFDDLEVPAENLIGEEGKGFRYILDGMNAERILIAAECIGDGQLVHRQGHRLRQGARGVRPADRPEPGRAVPDRRAPMRRCAAAELMVHEAAALFDARQALRRRGQHGEAARLRGLLGGGRHAACRPTAASASPRSTTSSASSARRGSTRSRRSRPT